MQPLLPFALGALLALPLPAAAQGTPGWSPWGGPDSPGGMFGGNPLDARADADRDRRLTHDEVWSWLHRRFDLADRNRSGALEPDEVRGHAEAQATFRAADADRNGRITPDELLPLSERWFRAHDTDGNGVLSRRELPARAKRGGASTGEQGRRPPA